jgi:hypothetical protein
VTTVLCDCRFCNGNGNDGVCYPSDTSNLHMLISKTIRNKDLLFQINLLFLKALQHNDKIAVRVCISEEVMIRGNKNVLNDKLCVTVHHIRRRTFSDVLTKCT